MWRPLSQLPLSNALSGFMPVQPPVQHNPAFTPIPIPMEATNPANPLQALIDQKMGLQPVVPPAMPAQSIWPEPSLWQTPRERSMFMGSFA